MSSLPSSLSLKIAFAAAALAVTYGLLKRRRLIATHSLASVDELFLQAAEFFGKNSKYFTADVQLEFYALFKQATCGDAPCHPAREGVMTDAWIDKRGMSVNDAESEYVALLDAHFPRWREISPEDSQQGWAVGSMMADAIGDSSARDDSIAGQMCELSAQGNLPELAKLLKSHPVDSRDVDGMTPLHWAADRGQLEVVAYLLERNANPNALDHSLNSPLHIAGMAAQKEVVRLLIDSKADLSLVNTEGESGRSILRTELPKLFLS